MSDTREVWVCRCGSRNLGPGNICHNCYDVQTSPSVKPAPQRVAPSAETAREWLKANYRPLLQRLMFSNDISGEDLAALLEAYHSSRLAETQKI
jgi:hypothetical protein